ncbi:hypothetical protein SK128_009147 [Halocaridina rubra]|uniref:BED-type domain-containing protein n=1 Tax=Halocaridina rubra TaxID=373956 RepID=A0AAN9A7L8_HALRR
MTEVVDKTLIERLILERSERLELEINQKARADAWKFYYRVRVDHVIRPFAVCKVCYRVLHCDSRSGTASLLRHPCNPLSERSPVNRAVKLSAKLNLPVDATLKGDLKNDNYFHENHIKEEFTFKSEPVGTDGGGSARSSPVSLTTSTSRASPTSTGSPPTAAQPTTTAAAFGGSRKRKTGAPPASFPLDFRLLPLPQLVAAAAAHPFNLASLANATALFADPQRLQHLQQQLHHSHLEHLHRQQQQQQQLQRDREKEEQDAKKARLEEITIRDDTAEAASPREASSSCWSNDAVKKESADTSDSAVPEDLRGSASPNRRTWHNRGGQDEGPGRESPVGGLTKEVVQQLVNRGSSRVTLTEKDSGGSHYISDVWVRFSVVCVDGMQRPFAACKNCLKVVTYTKYSGTGGLLRHRCSASDAVARPSGDGVVLPTDVDPRLGDSPPPTVYAHSPAHAVHPISPQGSPLSLSIRRNSEEGRPPPPPEEPPLAPTAAMSGVARALLRYMCHDLVPASSLDSTAFQRLVWTVLNLGAAHGTFREEEPLPSARQLLNTFLTPMAGDSRSVIARSVLDQTNLCLSIHRDSELGLFTGAIHFINPKFELRSYALGAHRIVEPETEDETVKSLLAEFFSDVWVPAAMRDKHVTVVSDSGTPSESGVVGVRCVWHATEAVLEALSEEQSYRQICDDVAAVLSFLADSGVAGVTSCGLQPHEVKRWDALLHALTFITAHHDELCVVMAGCEAGATLLGERRSYQEVAELLTGFRKCLLTVRDPLRPTLNQAVLCRAKLLQLCATPAVSPTLKHLKQHLTSKLTEALALTPLHHVASFLDPRCKSLKVLTDTEKSEVHRHVLEMMKSVAITEANSGVLNLKTTRTSNSSSSNYHSSNGHPTDAVSTSNDAHPFREYMDNPAPDTSVSDSEEIMAYVNMKEFAKRGGS